MAVMMYDGDDDLGYEEDDDDGVGEDDFVGACIKILNASMKVSKLWLFLF